MVYNPQPNHQPTFGYSSWHSYGWITVNRPLCSTDRQHFIPAPAFVLFPLQHLLVGTAQRFDSTGNILQVPPEITDHSYSAQVFFLTCKPLLRTKHGWSFDMCIQQFGVQVASGNSTEVTAVYTKHGWSGGLSMVIMSNNNRKSIFSTISNTNRIVIKRILHSNKTWGWSWPVIDSHNVVAQRGIAKLLTKLVNITRQSVGFLEDISNHHFPTYKPTCFYCSYH